MTTSLDSLVQSSVVLDGGSQTLPLCPPNPLVSVLLPPLSSSPKFPSLVWSIAPWVCPRAFLHRRSLWDLTYFRSFKSVLTASDHEVKGTHLVSGGDGVRKVFPDELR